MANHNTTSANSTNQNQSTPTTIYLNFPSLPPSQNYQTIIFGILDVSLALVSIYMGYLQLKHSKNRDPLPDAEMGVVGYDIDIMT
jgi:hypothetical protein